MTNAAELLQWHYLIFLLPMGVAALLLLLSSLRLGHHGGHGGHHAHTPVHGGTHAAHGGQAARPAPAAARTGTAGSANSRNGTNATERPNVTVTNHLVLNLTGANRAPLILIAEAFLLIWGGCGLLAHQIMAHGAEPSSRQLWMLVSIALVGGLVGARVAASLIGRFMPQEETLIVSRNELIGLTGTVVYPVSQTAGRLHIYDTFGTLHDEMCRLAPGQSEIAKGRSAMVLDMDTQGHLLVEEMH